MEGIYRLAASIIGGTRSNRKGISDIEVQAKVLQAAVRGIGDSFDAPGRMKYWLQAQTPTPITALPTMRLNVAAARYLL